MTRKELYNEIKAMNLQDEVIATYGKNFTQCTNFQLETIISGAKDGLDEDDGECAFLRLIEVLQKKNILLKSEIKYIFNANDCTYN